MWLSPNYTLDIILFYGIIYFAAIITFWNINRNLLYSVLVATLFTLVGSEYYEIPLFAAGYLGLKQGPTNVWHDIIKIMLFATLVYATRLYKKKGNIILFALGPIITALLLLPHYCFSVLYLAKALGFIFLSIVTINSPGVGGKNASNTPNKTNSQKLR